MSANILCGSIGPFEPWIRVEWARVSRLAGGLPCLKFLSCGDGNIMLALKTLDNKVAGIILSTILNGCLCLFEVPDS